MNGFLVSIVFQILNTLVLMGWIAMAIIALVKLSRIKLPVTPQTLWVLIILCMPILGAAAFFIVKPEKSLGKGHTKVSLE